RATRMAARRQPGAERAARGGRARAGRPRPLRAREPPHGLPGAGRHHPDAAPRVRALRGLRRPARAPLAAGRVGPHPDGGLRRADRVHRLDLPAHADREPLPPAGRRGRLRRELHRALRRLGDLPGRAHARRLRAARPARPAGQRGHLRVRLPPRAARFRPLNPGAALRNLPGGTVHAWAARGPSPPRRAGGQPARAARAGRLPPRADRSPLEGRPMQPDRAATNAARAHRRRPRRALPPWVACVAALPAAACNDRSRPGLEPTVGPDSASTIVYGTVFESGRGPAAGVRVRAAVTRQGCSAPTFARIPETHTDQSGAYRLELAVESEPFEGCVLLEVDVTLETLQPDTVVPMPGVQFRPFPPSRDSIRKDVTMKRP